MKRTEQKIADLEIARDQINARIHVTKARKSDQERRRTTRQKIVLGSGVISLARERDGFKIWLLAALRPKVAARDWPLIEEALSNREV